MAFMMSSSFSEIELSWLWTVAQRFFVRKDLSKEERRTESLLLRTLLGEGIQSSRFSNQRFSAFCGCQAVWPGSVICVH